MATPPAYASHLPKSNPGSRIHRASTTIGHGSLRAGNHPRHVSPSSFSCRSWIVACFAWRFVAMTRVTLWCMIWNSRCSAKMSMCDRWPATKRRPRLSRLDRRSSSCCVDDLQNNRNGFVAIKLLINWVSNLRIWVIDRYIYEMSILIASYFLENYSPHFLKASKPGDGEKKEWKTVVG